MKKKSKQKKQSVLFFLSGGKDNLFMAGCSRCHLEPEPEPDPAPAPVKSIQHTIENSACSVVSGTEVMIGPLGDSSHCHFMNTFHHQDSMTRPDPTLQ